MPNVIPRSGLELSDPGLTSLGAAYLWRLHEVTESLAGAATPHEVARAVVGAAVPALGALMGRLLLLTPDGKALETAAVLNLPDRLAGWWQRVELDLPAPVTDAIKSGEPVAVATQSDLRAQYPAIASYFENLGAEALYAVPLRIGDRRLGALVCVWSEPHEFAVQEPAFIAALAGICAQALDRARLLEAERRARHRAERLQALTAALSAAVSTQEASRVSLEEGMRALGARAGGVVLLTPDGEHQELVSLGGVSAEAVGRQSWWRFALSEPYPVNDVVLRKAPLFMQDIDEFERRFPKVAPTVREAGYQAYVAAPLEVEGRVIGAINYNFVERRSFDDDDVALVRAVAQQCAQALERARLYDAEQAARSEADAARVAAEAANQVKGQFLATMSHELRTPLNAIAGHTELLELGIHGPVSEDQRDALHRIQRSQKHLLSLINEVLNYARVEAGAVRYDMSPVGVMGALSAAESIMLPQIRAKGLTITVATVDPALTIVADSEKLSQILLNLLSNAIKFTPRGGRVTLSGRARDDGTVEIVVSDTGSGIAADQLERIFEPFVQVGRMLNSGIEGTGLGLAISRDLARGMGGDITVVSSPGAGSSFTLRLPGPERA